MTLSSGKPDQTLVIDHADNNYFALFVQDDWRIRSDLTFNVGLRYEFDTDVKNISRVDEINPIVQPFLSRRTEERPKQSSDRALVSTGRRAVPGRACTAVTGFITTASPSRSSRSNAASMVARCRLRCARATCSFSMTATGQFPPFAPSTANPFTGFILPGAGASGINIIDNGLQNPMVQQFNLGIQHELTDNIVLRVDGVHNLGTHFIIGRAIGTVFNPVVGGPDRVLNLESSVRTHYDALLVSAERRGSRFGFRTSYALANAKNYANDDQIPFGNGPIDPNDLRREFGPTPNDQRHRFTFAGWFQVPAGFVVAPLLTLASAVPMDILMPDGQSRVPAFERNAGGRVFKTAAELNRALRVDQRWRRHRRSAAAARPRRCGARRRVQLARSPDLAPVRLAHPADRADPGSLQRVQYDQHPWGRRAQLLGLLECAGARQLHPRRARVLPVVEFRACCHDRRRSLRVGRTEGVSARSEGYVLDSGFGARGSGFGKAR